MTVLEHPTATRVIPPEVRCAWCEAWIPDDLFHELGRLPFNGILVTCPDYFTEGVPSPSIAYREHEVERIANAVMIATEPLRIDVNTGGFIARLSLGESASVSEERLLQAAATEGLTFAEFWAHAQAAYAAGQELDEYLAGRRRVDADGRITYEDEGQEP